MRVGLIYKSEVLEYPIKLSYTASVQSSLSDLQLGRLKERDDRGFHLHIVWAVILEPMTIRAICFTMIGECFTTNLRVLQLTRCFLQLAMRFVQLTIVHLQSASQFTTMLYNQPLTIYNQEYRHLQSTSEILQVYLLESLIVNGVDICSCKTLSLQLTPQMHHTCSWLYYN